MKTINEGLKEMRIAQRISQAEIAKKSGISKQMVSKMEIPGSNMTLDTLSKYCVAIGVDLNLTFKKKSNNDREIENEV